MVLTILWVDSQNGSSSEGKPRVPDGLHRKAHSVNDIGQIWSARKPQQEALLVVYKLHGEACILLNTKVGCDLLSMRNVSRNVVIMCSGFVSASKKPTTRAAHNLHGC